MGNIGRGEEEEDIENNNARTVRKVKDELAKRESYRVS